MVRAQDLTPEEAKQYLMDQQKRTRERQRDFAKRRYEEGYKRVNAFISPEAFEIIDAERKATGQNTGDVISRIITAYQEVKAEAKPVKKKSKPVSTNKPKMDEDRAKLADEARSLKAEGMSLQAIADHFISEGYVNAWGKVSWNKSSIKRLIDK